MNRHQALAVTAAAAILSATSALANGSQIFIAKGSPVCPTLDAARHPTAENCWTSHQKDLVSIIGKAAPSGPYHILRLGIPQEAMAWAPLSSFEDPAAAAAITPVAPPTHHSAAARRPPTVSEAPGLVTVHTHGRPGGDVVISARATGDHEETDVERYADDGTEILTPTTEDLKLEAYASSLLIKQSVGPAQVQLAPGGPVVPCVGQSPWSCTIRRGDLHSYGIP